MKYSVAKTTAKGTIVMVGTYNTEKEAKAKAKKVAFSFVFKHN